MIIITHIISGFVGGLIGVLAYRFLSGADVDHVARQDHQRLYYRFEKLLEYLKVEFKSQPNEIIVKKK